MAQGGRQDLLVRRHEARLCIVRLLREAPLSRLLAHRQCTALAFASPERLVSGGGDGQLKLWRSVSNSSPSCSATVEAHPKSPVNVVAVSACRHFLASGGDDGTAALWDAATFAAGPPLARLPHSSFVISLAFDPSFAHTLASAECGDCLRIFDTRTARAELSLCVGAPLVGLDLPPAGGQLCLAATAEGAALFDSRYSRGEPLVRYACAQLDASPAFDEASGCYQAVFTGHSAAVTAVSYLEGDKVLTSAVDGSHRIWDLHSGAGELAVAPLAPSVSWPCRPVLAAIAGGRAPLLLSGNAAGSAALWDLERGALSGGPGAGVAAHPPACLWQQSGCALTAAALAPGGDGMATGDAAGYVGWRRLGVELS